MSGNTLDNITKIGNYTLHSFGAFLTASFCIGKLDWKDDRDKYLLISFAFYTMLSAFIAYWHRLAYLRHKNRQGILKIEKPSDLSTRIVTFFMLLHFASIVGLYVVIYKFVWK